MGNTFAKSVFSKLTGSTEVRILMLGLDAAGKTTALYKMKLGEVVTTIPTIGFNVETASYKNVNFTAWDVGGRNKIRSLLRHYYQNTNGIVFVVDSNDRERISEVTEELCRTLAEEELKDIPLLVFANKQDLPNAMSIEEISDKLGLNAIKNREWHIQPACMVSGDGMYEGLDWLSQTIGKGLVLSKTKTSDQVKPEEKSNVWLKNLTSILQTTPS